ncbi:hypothetical protein [Denitromonas sp.]|uniref:hypothetical protein n=1 Tax=Denitromonas sp. TaxID=2734609 RepID=UPI003A888F5A
MTEPLSGTAALINVTAAGGIAVLGVATGLHPGVLLAGLAGGYWALTALPSSGGGSRIAFLVVSALVAGYLAPVAATVAAAAAASMLPWWPPAATQDVLRFPAGLLVGFLAVRWLGPALLRRAKTVEETPQ